MAEPELAADQIQGNVAPGFRLPHQAIVGVQAGLAEAASLVEAILPTVTTMAVALEYHRERVAVAKTLHVFGTSSFAAVGLRGLRWLNIGIADPLLQAARFTTPGLVDRSFKLGLASRSATLGDPKSPGEEGHKSTWLLGGPSTPAPLLFILGSDVSDELGSFVADIISALTAHGATLQHCALGSRLSGDVEHFGFRDGVSQPGLRGQLGGDASKLLTRRKLAPPTNPDAPEFSAPGEILLWPGEFIFGYPRQDPHHFRRASPETETDPFLANGSFLVYRRLRQKVAAFRTSTASIAADLRARTEFAAVSDDWLRANLVGRWPSGAPLIAFPDADPGSPPVSLDAFNHFGFREKTETVVTSEGEPVTGSPADPEGLRCPIHTHIRKVNPRDLSTNIGPAAQTQQARILRRGIPYGPPATAAEADDSVDRGLLFLAYQRSIREQFERLSQDWMNSTSNPEKDRGHDLLVGQVNNVPGGRSCTFTRAPAGPFYKVSTLEQWIVPTGGGYYFCPSLDGLRQFSTARPQSTP